MEPRKTCRARVVGLAIEPQVFVGVTSTIFLETDWVELVNVATAASSNLPSLHVQARLHAVDKALVGDHQHMTASAMRAILAATAASVSAPKARRGSIFLSQTTQPTSLPNAPTLVLVIAPKEIARASRVSLVLLVTEVSLFACVN